MKPVLEQGDTVTTCFGDLNDVWGWGLIKKKCADFEFETHGSIYRGGHISQNYKSNKMYLINTCI